MTDNSVAKLEVPSDIEAERLALCDDLGLDEAARKWTGAPELLIEGADWRWRDLRERSA